MDRRLIATARATLALTLVAGCCVLALLVWRGPAAKGGWDEWLLLLGPVGATALVTAPVWWLVVLRPGSAGWVRGATAGLSSALLSYLLPALMAGFVGGSADTGQFDLGRAIGYTLLSLMLVATLTGWYTVPAVAATGAVMGAVQGRHVSIAQSEPDKAART
jgi:hypothetical protein